MRTPRPWVCPGSGLKPETFGGWPSRPKDAPKGTALCPCCDRVIRRRPYGRSQFDTLYTHKMNFTERKAAYEKHHFLAPGEDKRWMDDLEEGAK